MEKKIPWDLFTKLLNDELSDADSKKFDFWRDSSKLNQTIYEEITEDQSVQQALKAGKWNNNTYEWKKLQKKITPPEQQITLNRRTVFCFAAIAATVVFFLGISYILQSKKIRVLQSYEGEMFVYSPRGQRTELTLPDNTKVWLNSGSSLRYPANFNKKNRNVKIEGEAFFEVEKNPAKPFIVNTGEVKVKVYGTSFNIKAFPDEQYIETTLIKGKLSVMPHKVKKEIFLSPNEKCIYKKTEKKVVMYEQTDTVAPTKTKKPARQIEKQPKEKHRIVIEKNIDPEEEKVWKDGRLIFKNEPFGKLAIKLERWFNVKIHFEDEEIKQYKYTGAFEKETVNQAMEALHFSSQQSYKYKIIYRDIYLSAE